MANITGGVDTHLDVHVAAALNEIGGLLGTRSFATTPAGYRALLDWLASFGEIVKVGVEGTSSYGTGLTRSLLEQGIDVVEVDRPNRRDRRRKGKSDTLDAINAARAALSGEASAAPKSKTGNVESIRVLRVTRGGANKARTQAVNQLRALVATAPEELRDRLRGLTIHQLVNSAAALRSGRGDDTTAVTKLALRSLARRVQQLDAEIAELDRVLHPLVKRTAPKLVAVGGVGPDTAAALLTAAGQPAPAASRSRVRADVWGRSDPCRIRQDRRPAPATPRRRPASQRRAMADRDEPHELRPGHEGLRRTPRQRRPIQEVMRCLKRYVARELFPLIVEIAA